MFKILFDKRYDQREDGMFRILYDKKYDQAVLISGGKPLPLLILGNHRQKADERARDFVDWHEDAQDETGIPPWDEREWDFDDVWLEFQMYEK